MIVESKRVAGASESPQTEDEEAAIAMPGAQSVFLGGLFIMALLAGCYTAQEIILPLVLALILKLVLQPVMRVLTKLHVPRLIAALLVIVLLFGSFFALGSAVSAPATEWAKEFSTSMPKLQRRLHFLTQPVTTLQNILNRADGLGDAGGAKPMVVAMQGTRLSDRLLTDSRTFLAGMFQTVLMVFFMLLAGDTFLRRIVETLPRFRDKRHAVEISQQIESNISVYLATITTMNILVGFITGLIMFAFHIKDPVLWGTIAFTLNYIPIMGPIGGVVLFGAAGLVSIGDIFAALLPAGLYYATHLVESMYVTPYFLARRFTLNPVLVIFFLMFWFWMWGVPGAIISTPMLAIVKIICDHIPSLKPIGHFIEGENRGGPGAVA